MPFRLANNLNSGNRLLQIRSFHNCYEDFFRGGSAHEAERWVRRGWRVLLGRGVWKSFRMQNLFHAWFSQVEAI